MTRGWPTAARWWCAALALLAACGRTPSATKPAASRAADRVLVVVNRQSAASLAVGRYYMQQREVQPSHLVEIDVEPQDEVNDLVFRARILGAVRSAIASLPVRIDFIVLTTGVPLRIGSSRGYSVDAHLAGMNLPIPPMVGLDETWLSRYRNPYYGAQVPFDSDRFGMYLVTRLDCEEVADCTALVDRSIAAQPVRGPFYLDAMARRGGSDGYAVLNRALFSTALRLQLRGLYVRLDTAATFVALDEPVMGYASWGSNDSHFDSAQYHAIRFLPGALAETFVSTSARTFRPVRDGQSRIADLVAQGVTGVKGYVSEPFTLALADPGILFDRYTSGFTLAESFYAASRMVLWKDVVIGDPLCAPYAVTGPAFMSHDFPLPATDGSPPASRFPQPPQ